MLSDRMLSLAVDTGIYLGETLRDRSLYGQPVLGGFGRSPPMTPVQIAIVFAQGLMTGVKGPGGLLQVHDAWAELAGQARQRPPPAG